MERFRCHKCNAEFSTREQLERHEHQHGMERGRPGANTRPDGQSTRSPGDTLQTYRCPRCGAEFRSREELDRHERAQHQAS